MLDDDEIDDVLAQPALGFAERKLDLAEVVPKDHRRAPEVGQVEAWPPAAADR